MYSPSNPTIYQPYAGEDEPIRVPNDGRLLSNVSLALAIGGILIPIVLAIGAIICAAIAKKRLGKGPDVKSARSVASGAQVIATLDFVGFTLWATYVMSVYG